MASFAYLGFFAFECSNLTLFLSVWLEEKFYVVLFEKIMFRFFCVIRISDLGSWLAFCCFYDWIRNREVEIGRIMFSFGGLRMDSLEMKVAPPSLAGNHRLLW